jgi:hypothetical protein
MFEPAQEFEFLFSMTEAAARVAVSTRLNADFMMNYYCLKKVKKNYGEKESDLCSLES